MGLSVLARRDGEDAETMTHAPAPAPARTRAQIPGRTLRTDPWWRQPRLTAPLLTNWVAYATVHVFTGHWHYVPQDHYLTPFYSPCVGGVAARLDHPRHADAHRAVHPARGQRRVLRSQILQLGRTDCGYD